MAIGKNDQHARHDLGSETFDAIPKSIFATLAFRLADRLGGGNADRDQVFPIMVEELQALATCGIVPQDQAVRAMKALNASPAPAKPAVNRDSSALPIGATVRYGNSGGLSMLRGREGHVVPLRCRQNREGWVSVNFGAGAGTFDVKAENLVVLGGR